MLATPAILAAPGARAQAAPLPFYTAGPGSAFLPYGEAVARRDLLARSRRSGRHLEIASGDSATLAEATLRGETDALWQGAVLPIPVLVAVANGADGVIIGPGEEVSRGVVARLPHLAPLTVAAGTYRGQDVPVMSFAARNFVIAHLALPEEVAHAVTRAVLSATDPRPQISAAAAGTRADNAGTNRVLAFHPGAIRALREAGATVPELAPPA